MDAADRSGIEIRSAAERVIRPVDLKPLFRQADWTKDRDEHAIALLLHGPSICVAAWRSGRIVGFARAVSDGVCRAFVEDVIVDSDERGNGLGYRLMERLLRDLDGVQEIKLSCVSDLVPFYGKLGFASAGLVGMERGARPFPSE